MPELCVNIDHVATVRQARRGMEPDPVRAAHEAELGGAHGITVHLREDRRHIQDHDVERLRCFVQTKLNLEMAATDEMVAIANRIKPHTVMLVPEGRQEITTEGGLDVKGQKDHLARIVGDLKDSGALVSAFIDPDPAQVDAAAELGFDICEVHTGPFAHAAFDAGHDLRSGTMAVELDKVEVAGRCIVDAGMRFNAGHALNYQNVVHVAALDDVEELHIGHSIVSRAVFSGLRDAVRDMLDAMAG
jgi:pyridoxine 5-phosphate synthase